MGKFKGNNIAGILFNPFSHNPLLFVNTYIIKSSEEPHSESNGGSPTQNQMGVCANKKTNILYIWLSFQLKYCIYPVYNCIMRCFFRHKQVSKTQQVLYIEVGFNFFSAG